MNTWSEKSDNSNFIKKFVNYLSIRDVFTYTPTSPETIKSCISFSFLMCVSTGFWDISPLLLDLKKKEKSNLLKVGY